MTAQGLLLWTCRTYSSARTVLALTDARDGQPVGKSTCSCATALGLNTDITFSGLHCFPTNPPALLQEQLAQLQSKHNAVCEHSAELSSENHSLRQQLSQVS